MPRNKLTTDAAVWSPAHCQHLYGNRKSSNNRTKKMLRSTRSRGYLGSGLTDASSSIEMILLLLLLLPYHNASENTEKASELSSHSLSHPPTFSQPSRQPHRPLSARNSALLLISSPDLLIGGFVFLWGGLVQIEVSVPSAIRQAGARCLPLLEPSGYGADSLLSGSRSQ